MSIANLSDLVAEIRDELDDSGYPSAKIYRAIARAEAYFNRELRVPQMETVATLTVTGESTALPANFLQMRAIYQDGSPDLPLSSMSPEGLRQLYSGQSGPAASYAIEGSNLIVAPVGNAIVKMLYYAAIPALTESNTTNWLLTDNPDIYIHHTLAIIFARIGDDERAASNLGIATQLIEQANKAGKNARWGASPLKPVLVQQVPGARI